MNKNDLTGKCVHLNFYNRDCCRKRAPKNQGMIVGRLTDDVYLISYFDWFVGHLGDQENTITTTELIERGAVFYPSAEAMVNGYDLNYQCRCGGAA